MPVINENLLRFIQGPRLPGIVSALLVLMMAWWAVAQVLPLLSDDKSENLITSISTSPPTAIANKQLPLNMLNLFGIPENKAAVNKASTTKITKLKLTLRGILATEDPRQGVAQIQNAKKEERHFVVSDSVFGQATLEEIHIDRVILLHDGRYETLILPEEFLDVKHFSAEKQRLERKKIATDYRKLFLNRDAEKLRKLFGFDTAWKNGGFAGFIVKALSDKGREMMATLGIEDGDLITVVNGLRFSESLEAAQQLTELKTATSVDIIIERNGQEIPFHIEFDAPLEDIAAVPGGNNDSQQTNNTGNADSDTSAPSVGSVHTDSKSTGRNSNNYTSSSSSDDNSSTATSETTNSIRPAINYGPPQQSFDEKEGAEEFKRKQRERTISPATPVEYDH
ncbi:MAG: type II secretion system protein N [Gammaproteobacteria bacterium]